MARTARKADANVPRKRVISQPPPAPKKGAQFTVEFSAVCLLVFALFLCVALYSQLTTFGSPETLREEAASSRANVMGPFGAHVASGLLRFLGYCSFMIVAWALLLARSICTGWKVGTNNPTLAFSFIALSSFVFLISSAVIASVLFGFSGGGLLGTTIALLLIDYVNEPGTLLIAATTLLLSLGVATGIGALSFLTFFRQCVTWFGLLLKDGVVFSGRGATLLGRPIAGALRRRGARGEGDDDQPFTLDDDDVRTVRRPATVKPEPPLKERSREREKALKESLRPGPEVRILRKSSEDLSEGKKKREKKEKPEKPHQAFQLPGPDFLVRGETSARTTPKDKELIENSRRLEETLENFRVGGKVVEVQPGPVITLYQFEPAPGVKVQRVISLADDLALALKVASVRVYAPVPGKGTVGIEVPNAHREIVRLRDLVETKAFHDQQLQIALALGKDTFGDPFISDLSRMPHLLIAGATGTGKSVCINSLLLSLLYRNTPDELRLILIDPKMLELSVYEDIPHLKAPVVTLAKRARGVLWWAVEEMERRYALMKDVGVRNLAGFNALVTTGSGKLAPNSGKKSPDEIIELMEKDVVSTSSELPPIDREGDEEPVKAGRRPKKLPTEPLPRIVIVVDELADLMLTVGREIEELLTRLAQKARAAGIHLVLATQRPSVNVITGLIKANFPSRISFKVASRIDARTVLDTSGAEKLLGQGDMLFLSPGAGRPRRLHSPFVSDKEVHDVVDFLREQGKPDYDEHIQAMIERLEQQENQSGGTDGSPEEYDPLYDQAVQYVVEKGLASTSLIQRIFRIGYNRAARILETMERDGIVGPADGAKPRQVLMPNRDAEI